MGELLPNGLPRFRIVLALVARQNGKTVLARILTLYWMFVERVPLILGTSASRDAAKESWSAVIEMAQKSPLLAVEIGPKAIRASIGEECFTTLAGSRYRFAAPNRRAGRGLTVHRNVMDELREHDDWETHDASVNAMNAVRDGQVVAITNQGDARSVVLDSLRDAALAYLETGVGDERLGLFEWSAPSGADPTDLQALGMANPDLGGRIDPYALQGRAQRAKSAGGAELAAFRTEVMCQRVTLLDAAIDPDAWSAAGTTQPINLADHRDRLALCLDVSLDGSHATLVAAATIGGLTHVEVVETWTGYGATQKLRRDLPALVDKLRPRVVGWFPGGPAAAVTAALSAKNGNRAWPPRRVKVEELTGDHVARACMGLADVVRAGEIRHPYDEMLTSHVKATQRLKRGDVWVYTRRGSSPIDATYALAGAVHLARMMTERTPLVAL